MPRHDVEGGARAIAHQAQERALRIRVVKELVELESAQRHKVHLGDAER
jgi:hypothetical protein